MTRIVRRTVCNMVLGAVGMFLSHSRFAALCAFCVESFLLSPRSPSLGRTSVPEALMLAPMGSSPAMIGVESRFERWLVLTDI
jgi:hypothetical protein